MGGTLTFRLALMGRMSSTAVFCQFLVGALRVTSSGVVWGEAGTGVAGGGWLLARCWVLRKRAGLVLLSMVVCAVRMPAVAGGIRSTLFLGLLLRSQSGCAWWCCCSLVGVRVLLGVLGCGCGGWLGPLGIEPLHWMCVGRVFRGLVWASGGVGGDHLVVPARCLRTAQWTRASLWSS